MNESYYELSINLTTYNSRERKLYLKYKAAVKNGMNPEDNIRHIRVHGKTRDVMFERTTNNQYLYYSSAENLVLEIIP